MKKNLNEFRVNTLTREYSNRCLVISENHRMQFMQAHPDAVQNIHVLPDASETIPAFFIDPVEEAVSEEVEQVF